MIIQHVMAGYSGQDNEIQLNSDSDTMMVLVDQLRIEIVFKNLLNNAIKYSSDDGSVEVNLSKKDGMANVVIKDHGKGIPESEIPFIFESFYRVDKSRSKKTGGFGLGLSICKQIIEAHGGNIDIESQEGKGTTVIVQLPV